MRSALTVALAALVLLAAAPPAQAAFHGSKWTATGVATDATNHVYLMTLAWSGFCQSTWTVTIKDAVSGAVVTQRSFSGYEAQSGRTISYAPELLISSGYAFDPRIHFTSSMVQLGTVSPGPRITGQAVQGSYEGFTLTGAVAEAWNFC